MLGFAALSPTYDLLRWQQPLSLMQHRNVMLHLTQRMFYQQQQLPQSMLIHTHRHLQEYSALQQQSAIESSS